MRERDIYHQLGKMLHEMLTEPKFFADELEKFRDSFSDGLIETMQICMDISVDAEKLSILTDELAYASQEEAIDSVERYLEFTMENPDVYIILNKYMLDSLLIFTKHIPEASISMLDELYDKHYVNKALLKEILDAWEDLKKRNTQ